MNNEIYEWKQKGNIYFWLFLDNVENFPGYNLAFDVDGKSSLLSLLCALKGSPVDTFRTVKLSAPTKEVLSVPNNGGNILTRESIKIFHDEHSSIGIKEFHSHFELRADSILFDAVERKLISIKSGEELEIKIDDNYLNFWW